MKALILTALVAASLPLAAPAATPADSLKYYAGTWACFGGPLARRPVNATTTYTFGDDGILRERLTIPKQPGMKHALSDSSAAVYDAQHKRFVEVEVDSQANWAVSTAKPWTGNTETWFDYATSDGKLGRTVENRQQNAFVITVYASPTSAKAIFRASCKRS